MKHFLVLLSRLNQDHHYVIMTSVLMLYMYSSPCLT